MTTITIEVPDELADKYNRAPDEERKQLQLKLAFLFELERKKNIERLFSSMHELSQEAQQSGLTLEILEDILNEK
ncbi:MAG: hypothetical protein SNJ55_12010 [Chloroherpetonaceae bacterium]